ncbi:MAG: DUF4157 domain-containing protein [Deltaproteobacteria bacterium]|nr:DUF4157 domain-containing protein [Deltaproteobacteria bacterium]
MAMKRLASRGFEADVAEVEGAGEEAAVGKRSLTEGLARRGEGAGEAGEPAAQDGPIQLPEGLRGRLEASAGADLGGVRLHTGAAAARSAAVLGARAYAVGQDVHFGAGEYAPGTAEGDHLVAHEVAHTLQQRGGGEAGAQLSSASAVGGVGDPAEQAADAFADAALRGDRHPVAPAAAAVRLKPTGGRAATPSGPTPPGGAPAGADAEKTGMARLLELAALPSLGLAELAEAQRLVMQLPPDEFRAFLNQAATSGLCQTLMLGELATAAFGWAPLLNSTAREVRLDTVVIGTVADTNAASAQFERARDVFREQQVGLELELSSMKLVDPREAKELGGDSELQVGGFQEYKISKEIMNLIDRYASAGKLTVIWVPTFSSGNRGLTLTPELFSAKKAELAGRAAILIDSSLSREDTLAHELGHALGADASGLPHVRSEAANGDQILYSGDNLMATGDERAADAAANKREKPADHLDPEQIAFMRESIYVTLGKKGNNQ